MSAFKVGDVCVIVAAKGAKQFIGMQCTIVAVGCFGGEYRVAIHGESREWFADTHNLRRIDPPSTDLTPAIADDWQHIGWEPNKVKVTT